MHDIIALIWILVACFCVVEELDQSTYSGEKLMGQFCIVVMGVACTIVAVAVHLIFKLI